MTLFFKDFFSQEWRYFRILNKWAFPRFINKFRFQYCRIVKTINIYLRPTTLNSEIQIASLLYLEQISRSV